LKVCANCLAQSFSFYLKERIRILNTWWSISMPNTSAHYTKVL